MSMIRFTREVHTNELREVLLLAENQETTDKYIDTSLHIRGDYAEIKVDIDNGGNIIVL